MQQAFTKPRNYNLIREENNNCMTARRHSFRSSFNVDHTVHFNFIAFKLAHYHL